MPIPRQCRRTITRFFESITHDDVYNYTIDWTKLTPKSDQERLNRWRFAYCTVHTSWENSCDQYLKIKPTFDNLRYSQLSDLLRDSSGGMWIIKAVGINKLHQLWRNNSDVFNRQDNWQKYRNNICDKLPKLGLAKTSFAIEMLHPLNAQIICIDRHMFKAFGWENVDLACTAAQYHYYENYWVDMSNQYNIPPVLSRYIFWDKLQNQNNSLYWAKYL